jgi:AcrR family transcriptional regulator
VRAAGEATRERILAEAKKEFASRGLAGARINSIAAAASASKERLYAYFPSKAALFTAVAEQLYAEVSAATTLQGDDLPGYAERLFDSLLQHPENARLALWMDLESDEGIFNVAGRLDGIQSKIEQIRAGQRSGHIDPDWNPVELYILVVAAVRTMVEMSPAARKLAEIYGYEANADLRRAAAISAVKRLLWPARTAIGTLDRAKSTGPGE